MHSTTSNMQSPERRFGCHIPGCGKRFKRKFTLQEHLNTHTGARPYVCDYDGCKRCFSTHGNLNRHKFIHTGEKPFGCTTCLKRFCTKEKLVRHVKTHTNGLRAYAPADMTAFRKASTSTDDEGSHSDCSIDLHPIVKPSTAGEYCFDDEFLSSKIHDEILLALQSLDVEPTPAAVWPQAPTTTNNNDMLTALWVDEAPIMALPKVAEPTAEPFPVTWNLDDLDDFYTIKPEGNWFVPEPFPQTA